MSMYKNIQDILNVLWYDEELLRLLYYAPQDFINRKPDPLDKSLQNILDKPEMEQWDIRNRHIMLTPKDDDLTKDKLCRLFVYLGDRDPSRGNYATANQEVIIDILCHADYENGDMRSTRLSDRLNSILVSEKITGVTRMAYLNGRQITRVPSQYVGYQHVYRYEASKK